MSYPARFFGILLLIVALPLASTAQKAAPPTAPPATAVIDWTRSDGQVNRPLFSTQGFMQIYVEHDPMVMDTFTLINPAGTQTRLETYIDRMEPENDNDNPNVINWSALHPEKQIRFINNRDVFLRTVARLGMEPLALLGYNVSWLKSGNPNDTISNHDEWAEFAAEVVQSYNGVRGDSYRPNLRFVEVWNEPNFSDFRMGTREAYFDLFKKTARRIHRDYPGVMVGGPCVTKADKNADQWMDDFITECGPDADYLIYHQYGASPEYMVNDITRWTDAFRRLPGKAQGKLMITETDQWINGWPKMQYIFDRQYRFLDISDRLLGVHHFCCLAYNESGNYTFGIVDRQGAVLGGTFWPYWLFRNLIGHTAYTMRQGERKNDFDLAGSWDTNASGQRIATAVFHNHSKKPVSIDTLLYFPPSKNDRVLVFNRTTKDFQGVDHVERIPSGADHHQLSLALSPGEGLSLNLQESGKRFFPFRDLDNQETPWIGLTADKGPIELGQECRLAARVVNPNFTPVSGMLEVRALPKGWKAEVVSGNPKVENLAFGKTQECEFQFKAATVLTRDRVAPYVILVTGAQDAGNTPQGRALVRDNDKAPKGPDHSIPVSIEVRNPLAALTLPIPVEAVPGETNQVTLQLTSQVNRLVDGTFEFAPPQGLTPAQPPTTFRIEANARKRFQFPFRVASEIQTGKLSGKIVLHFLGSSMEVPFTVAISKLPAHSSDAVPLDLSGEANFDSVAYNSDRKAFDIHKMGMFAYPGDFTPSNRVVRVRGVPFRMLPMEGTEKNCVLPQGQTIPVPEGNYSGVMFMGFGHDGKHHGIWQFHYTDGSSDSVNSQIPEWCSPLPKGPEHFQEAFTAPYRYIPGGPALPACQLFTWTLKPDPSKTLKSIELPKMEHAYLFAITLLKKQ